MWGMNPDNIDSTQFNSQKMINRRVEVKLSKCQTIDWLRWLVKLMHSHQYSHFFHVCHCTHCNQNIDTKQWASPDEQLTIIGLPNSSALARQVSILSTSFKIISYPVVFPFLDPALTTPQDILQQYQTSTLTAQLFWSSKNAFNQQCISRCFKCFRRPAVVEVGSSRCDWGH